MAGNEMGAKVEKKFFLPSQPSQFPPLMDVPTALSYTVIGNHQQVKQATEFLEQQDKKADFCNTLLQILSSNALDISIKHACAIYLKNYIRKYWPIGEDQDHTISTEACALIKKNILMLLLNAPNSSIQKQIADCLEMISLTDFPEQWPEILPELVQLTATGLKEQKFTKTIDLLKATYSVLRRYNNAPNNEVVNKELAFVLGHIATPLVENFKFCAALLETAKANNNTDGMKITFGLLHQLYRIFYCLCYVDLPEVVENSLLFFMEQHMAHLSFQNSSDELLGDDDDKPGVLLKVQAAICQNITLFTQKYEEEFTRFIQGFMESIWNLLTRIDHSLGKYDTLLARGMDMLTKVSIGVSHSILANEAILKQICEKIVIPNLMFRENDEINFEEEHLEYIRTDLEESNLFTRRNSACELVKGLRKYNESAVTQIFASYLTQLLDQYNTNPTANWKQKDVGFFLVTALTVSGGTRLQGVTVVNELVPIEGFLKEQVMTELQKFPDNHPVIQADALKFVITFRNQIKKELYGPIFSCAIKMLNSPQYVVSTYAASCLERLLVVKDGDVPRVGTSDLQSITNPILSGAFQQLATPKFENNDYLMRLVMRVLAVSQNTLDIGVAGNIMTQLQAIMARIAKNPTIPAFDHYVFETIGCLCSCLHAKDPALVSKFEATVLPTMSSILQSDTSYFSHYVYQLLAMFLELSPNTIFTTTHKELLTHIVTPATWSETGNIPALTRLIQAYLRKDIQGIVGANQLVPILGIFQKLVNSSLQDHHGMSILNVVLEVSPWEVLQPVIAQVFSVVFTRLQKKKTTKICCGFTLFLCRFVHKYTFAKLHEVLEAISAGVLSNVLGVWALALSNFGKYSECQLASLVTASILCDPIIVQPTFVNHWPTLAIGLARLVENKKKDVATNNNEDFFEKAENKKLGLQTSFVQLIHSSTPLSTDPLTKEVSQVVRADYVVGKLKPFVANHRHAMQAILEQVAKDANGKTLVSMIV